MPIVKDYLAAALLYNLQILPDSLILGTTVLAILLTNPTVAALAAGALGTQALTHAVGALLMAFQPGAAVPRSSLDVCTGGYTGLSWSRLFRMGTEHLWHPLAPSPYMTTLGYFAGAGASLSQLYKDEIDAGVWPRHTLIACGVITAILLILALTFRYASGCESFIGAVAGLLFGLALGYFGAIILGYATGRRATNLWGIPLLRDRINNGSAVYVCPPTS